MPQQFQRKWIVPIFLLGCLAGAIFIAPFLNLQITPGSNHTSLLHETAKILHISVEVLVGVILGGVISLFLIPLVFYRDPEINRGFKILEIGGWNQFTHPITLPLTLAIIWFLLLAIGAYFFGSIFEQLPEYFVAAAFLPFSFLFGLSGFQIIKRNEVVGLFGIIHNGFWAYLNGILLIVFGWVGFLYLTLDLVFNW